MTTPDHDPIRSARNEFEDSEVTRSHMAGSGEQPGDVVDRYKLLQEIGEGGMGNVWMAEQKEPVKRQVALKIIKLGMDSREVVARFEAERQALALMDHPHIAKVLDGGTTDTGRPYFVMELVRGVPITQYCDDNKLGLRERLELFTKVCDAIQHAHHKGVIHRDIKPGNVLVTLHDGVPVPRVIDFGIAKATSVELTQKTMFTQFGNMIGTPEYMAPEQAELSGLDIDTRADVYSLGVLLYELLTGSKPFSITDVLAKGYQELLRTIREEEPAKPSTRVSTMGAAASHLAGKQHANAQALSTRLRGELDWIVMRALEKDRTRRYDTPNGFAMDVHRYLLGEPVQAAPASALYRLRKFVSRRKKTVAAVAGMLLLLVGGSVGTTLGWVEAASANAQLSREVLAKEKQRQLAVENARLFQAASREAKQEAERARQAERAEKLRSEQLEAVSTFQEGQMDQIRYSKFGGDLRRLLIDAIPAEQRDQLTAILSQADFPVLVSRAMHDNYFAPTLELIDREFEDQPLVRARLLMMTAHNVRMAGRLADAIEPTERAHALLLEHAGPSSWLTLNAMIRLSAVRQEQGRSSEAEQLAREALALAPPESLDELRGLRIEALLQLAETLSSQAPREAIELYEETLALCQQTDPAGGRVAFYGPAGHRTLWAETRLLFLRTVTGDLTNEAPLLRNLARLRQSEVDEAHLASPLTALSLIYVTEGRHEEALAVITEGLKIERRTKGNHSENALALEGMRASCLLALGRNEQAIASIRQHLALLEAEGQGDSMIAASSRSNLGLLLQREGQMDEAYAVFQEMAAKMADDMDPTTGLAAMSTYSDFMMATGKGSRTDKVAALRRAVFYGHRMPVFMPLTRAAMNKSLCALGAAYLFAGNPEEAEPLLREFFEAADDEESRTTSMLFLSMCLSARGKFEEAGALVAPRLEQGHPYRTINERDLLLHACTIMAARNRHAEAATTAAEATRVWTEQLGSKHPDVIKALHQLAESHFATGDAASANTAMTRALGAWSKASRETRMQLEERDNRWMRARLRVYEKQAAQQKR